MKSSGSKWIQIFMITVAFVLLLLLLLVSINRQQLDGQRLHLLAKLEAHAAQSAQQSAELIAQNQQIQSLLTSIDKKSSRAASKGKSTKSSATKTKPKQKPKPVDYQKELGSMLKEAHDAKALFEKKKKDQAVEKLLGLKKRTWALSAKLEKHKKPLQGLMGIFDQVLKAWKSGKAHPAIKSIQGTYEGIIGKLKNSHAK